MSGKTFVGFGFGPIQSALFLYEAFRSGQFGRFVISEVDAAMVQAVQAAGGRYTINIALPDRIERATVTGVELYNPLIPEDRDRVIEAISSSDELATSLPSVAFFDRGGSTSAASMLAEGFQRRDNSHPAIVYTAENHNHAAELLREAVLRHCSSRSLERIQFLNTVIGKMSGVITDPASIKRLGLELLAPTIPRAVLVEEFNRILISRVELPGFSRGIGVFVEKADLLPFEEAKLYGHNAIHALIGFLASRRGLQTMAEAAAHPDIIDTARKAFIEESGAALIQKHSGMNDPLFTEAGFRAYAEDLLSRMLRPTLNDLISRVTRDPARKLGYDDRLFGTMRLAFSKGIRPSCMAKGAAAAVVSLIAQKNAGDASLAVLPPAKLPLTFDQLEKLLLAIWSREPDDESKQLVESVFVEM